MRYLDLKSRLVNCSSITGPGAANLVTVVGVVSHTVVLVPAERIALDGPTFFALSRTLMRLTRLSRFFS